MEQFRIIQDRLQLLNLTRVERLTFDYVTLVPIYFGVTLSGTVGINPEIYRWDLSPHIEMSVNNLQKQSL